MNKLLLDLNEINAPIRNTGFETSTIYNILYSVHQCRKNAIKETSLHQNCLQPKRMHRLYSLKALCAGSGPET